MYRRHVRSVCLDCGLMSQATIFCHVETNFRFVLINAEIIGAVLYALAVCQNK